MSIYLYSMTVIMLAQTKLSKTENCGWDVSKCCLLISPTFGLWYRYKEPTLE